MTTAITATGAGLRDDNGNNDWPGISSRFQLVFLAGQRSKQLFKGAHPRIPADPLRRRNTSIALEELRLGLVPFRMQNQADSQTSPAAVDTVENPPE
jgi:DNA-directed RNA polymerase omega subunit